MRGTGVRIGYSSAAVGAFDVPADIAPALGSGTLPVSRLDTTQDTDNKTFGLGLSLLERA